MKKDERKLKKANNYFLGGFTLPSGDKLAGAITGGLNFGSSLIPSSGSGKTDAITSGISAGLQTVGSAFGPAGQAVGAAAGLLTKGIGAIVGTSDSVNEATGEYVKGKGIKGRRSRGKMQAKWRRVNQGINDANLTTQLQEEYANEYGENDYSLAAYGGTLPTTLAYLDDGELLRTPSGQITAIPEQGKPTDSNLMNVPVGTQVLSDKLKVPGTNKTFAEVGKKYMKKDNTKAKDKYAENSRMLNNRNNQKKYDELMALQEQVKAKKDRKLKKGVPAYDNGTPGMRNVIVSPEYDWNKDIYGTPLYNRALSTVNLGNYKQANALQDQYYDKGLYKQSDRLTFNQGVADYQNTFNNSYRRFGDTANPINLQIGNLRSSGAIKGLGGSSDNPTEWKGDGLAGYQTNARHLGRNLNNGQLVQNNARLFGSGLEMYNDPDNQMAKFRPISRADVTDDDLRSLGYKPREIDASDVFKKDMLENVPPVQQNKNNHNEDEPSFWTGLGDALAGAANLIGPLANIRDSKPETSPVRTYTPHFGPVDYNVDPLVQQANLTNAINRYNIDRAGGAGRGANLAQAVQSGVVRNRAIADAYATKQNIENQRRFQNAGIYNDWARWDVENRHRGDVENAQNRAAARNLRRTGFSQLGTALASMNRDRRYTARDRALLNFMRPYLEYGSTQDQINKLYSQLS